MPTLLQYGGQVPLWAGWMISLPPCHHDRDSDGSFSAWGTNWTIDITIIETSGDAAGCPVRPEELLGSERPANLSGVGWIGFTRIIEDEDQGKAVYRLTAWLAAANTLMSCWISVLSVARQEFAADLLRAITHLAQKAEQGDAPNP